MVRSRAAVYMVIIGSGLDTSEETISTTDRGTAQSQRTQPEKRPRLEAVT